MAGSRFRSTGAPTTALQSACSCSRWLRASLLGFYGDGGLQKKARTACEWHSQLDRKRSYDCVLAGLENMKWAWGGGWRLPAFLCQTTSSSGFCRFHGPIFKTEKPSKTCSPQGASPDVFLETARLVHLVFGGGMFFFRPPAFFKPRNTEKRAQSFFQPLCIILSSLFLGPKTSCSELRIFFRTRDIFFWTSVLFFRPLPGDATQGEMRSKNRKVGIRQIRKQKQARKNKGTKLHATDNKNQNRD